MQTKYKLNANKIANLQWRLKDGCVFLKSLDRFLLVKLIRLSNYTMPY